MTEPRFLFSNTTLVISQLTPIGHQQWTAKTDDERNIYFQWLAGRFYIQIGDDDKDNDEFRPVVLTAYKAPKTTGEYPATIDEKKVKAYAQSMGIIFADDRE